MSITPNAASTSSQHGTATPTALTLVAAVTAGDLVCFFVANNKSGSYEHLSTVTSVPALTWTRRWVQENDSTSSTIKSNQELWTAPSPAGNGASGLAITATFNASTDAITMAAWSITGLPTSQPFDPNGGLPYTNTNTLGSNTAVTVTGVSTNNNDTAIFGFYGSAAPGLPTVQSGWTQLVNFDNAGGSNFQTMFVEYKLFSSAQAGITISPTQSANQWQFTADAFTSDLPLKPRHRAVLVGA